MTDLFFRIAERASGLAPTIQPMIAPLFAPVAYTESDEMLDILATEEQDSQKSHTPFAPPGARESNTPMEKHIQPAISSSASKELSSARRADIPPTAPIERGTPHYPELRRPPSQARVAVTEQTGSNYQDISLRTAPIATSGDAAEGIVDTVFPVMTRPEHTQEVGLETPAQWNSVQPLPTILPPASFSRQQSSPLTGTILYKQHGPSRTPARDNGDGLPGARPPQLRSEPLQEVILTGGEAPAIHVTIGRIEVRANPAPVREAQTQRQQAASKAMSLDEYLKQSEKRGH